jgi:PAS domain S-box-containing protein
MGCALTPLFLFIMGRFGRVELLERSRAAAWALCVPFAFFYLAYLTNDHHRLMVAGPPMVDVNLNPRESAGPLFWAYNAWCYLYVFWGLGICIQMLCSPSKADRLRSALILGGISAPIIAHSIHLLGILSIDYPLTPGSFGITALLLVAGVQRYGLLEEAPVVRRDVIDHLSDGLVLADASGVVIDVNPAAEAILGERVSALRGTRLESALALLQLAANEEELSGRLANLSVEQGEFSAELETGDGRVIEMNAGAVRARDSHPAGRFLVFRDRSAQRRSERLLRRRQKLESVGILAAGVAHEVNNPLAFVRANLVHLQQLASLLDKQLETSDDDPATELRELPEVLEESLAGLDRIARIVEGLLRFSRLSSEGTAPVDLNDSVGEAIRFAALHRSQLVQVETRLAENLPRVEGCADRLVQVLLNLLLNAKQALAAQANGRIIVETRRSGDRVEVRIADNGPGVPEEIQELIFDPFFTTRGPGEGTGLGLSIAFDILREHNGTLEVSSQSGLGACFTVRLPARNDVHRAQ